MNYTHRTLATLVTLVIACGGQEETSGSAETDVTSDAWKHLTLTAQTGEKIAVDYKVANEYQHESTITSARPLWFNVTFPAGCPSSVRVVVLNIYAQQGGPSGQESSMELDLADARDPGKCRFTGEANRQILISSGHLGYGYMFRQELAVVADGRWLQNPVGGENNFRFTLQHY